MAVAVSTFKASSVKNCHSEHIQAKWGTDRIWVPSAESLSWRAVVGAGRKLRTAKCFNIFLRKLTSSGHHQGDRTRQTRAGRRRGKNSLNLVHQVSKSSCFEGDWAAAAKTNERKRREKGDGGGGGGNRKHLRAPLHLCAQCGPYFLSISFSFTWFPLAASARQRRRRMTTPPLFYFIFLILF